MRTRTGRPGGLIFLSLVLLAVFCWIEVDLYAPSFPRIRQHFGTTEAMIKGSGYRVGRRGRAGIEGAVPGFGKKNMTDLSFPLFASPRVNQL